MGEQAPGQQPAAGWMTDPWGRHFGRYWDGRQWTDHVISAETVPSIDTAGERDREPERVPMKDNPTGPASARELAAGWMKDPSGRHSSRYWDGWRWTEHVMSAKRVPGIDPAPQPNADPRPPAATTKGARVAPASARTQVMPASASSQSLGEARSRPLPIRAWEGFQGWTRSAQWALGVIVCGMIIVGAAIAGDPPRPTVRNSTITRPVDTTPPLAEALPESTTPPTTQAPITAPTTPGGQTAVTSLPFVEPPTTVPRPGQSTDPDASTTS